MYKGSLEKTHSSVVTTHVVPANTLTGVSTAAGLVTEELAVLHTRRGGSSPGPLVHPLTSLCRAGTGPTSPSGSGQVVARKGEAACGLDGLRGLLS